MKLLIVTLPNDLGSRTIERNLCELLGPKCDMKLFRFAAQDVDLIDTKIDNRRNLLRRFQDALALRKAVRLAVREGRRILFYNVSPAMFAIGSWKGGKAYITMDWAGKLFSPCPRGLRAHIARINQMIFHSCAGLLPMTQSMADCLTRDYDVPVQSIHLVPSLFDVEHFDPGEISSSDHIRVLFVGGDIKRKGGDLLYEAFRTRLNNRCSLTMMTNEDIPPCKGFTLRKGIRYGTDEHLSLMRDHDILVLPTHQDSGPQVIGEAAAAGLAVLTTKAALGAPHVIQDGITGFISETPEECINALGDLLKYPAKILCMRKESLAHMRKNFSRLVVSNAYLDAMSD